MVINWAELQSYNVLQYYYVLFLKKKKRFQNKCHRYSGSVPIQLVCRGLVQCSSSPMNDGSALPILQVNEREAEERDTVHCASH